MMTGAGAAIGSGTGMGAGASVGKLEVIATCELPCSEPNELLINATVDATNDRAGLCATGAMGAPDVAVGRGSRTFVFSMPAKRSSVAMASKSSEAVATDAESNWKAADEAALSPPPQAARAAKVMAEMQVLIGRILYDGNSDTVQGPTVVDPSSEPAGASPTRIEDRPLSLLLDPELLPNEPERPMEKRPFLTRHAQGLRAQRACQSVVCARITADARQVTVHGNVGRKIAYMTNRYRCSRRFRRHPAYRFATAGGASFERAHVALSIRSALYRSIRPTAARPAMQIP